MYDGCVDEYHGTAAESGLSSVPLGQNAHDLRPPEHDRVCWASAIGGARRLDRHADWDASEALAAERLRTGVQLCICAKRKGQHKGRRLR